MNSVKRRDKCFAYLQGVDGKTDIPLTQPEATPHHSAYLSVRFSYSYIVVGIKISHRVCIYVTVWGCVCINVYVCLCVYALGIRC